MKKSFILGGLMLGASIFSIPYQALAKNTEAKTSNAAASTQQSSQNRINTLERQIQALSAMVHELKQQVAEEATKKNTVVVASAPAPADNKVLTEGKYPKSVRFPGSDMSFLWGGKIILDALYDPGQACTGGGYLFSIVSDIDTSTDGKSRRQQMIMSSALARLFFKAHKPLDNGGELVAHIEFDFNGQLKETIVNNSAARLRLAHLTWAPNDTFSLLVGQDSSTFAPAGPQQVSCVDFGQHAGTAGFTRQPLIRVTYKPNNETTLQASLENPELTGKVVEWNDPADPTKGKKLENLSSNGTRLGPKSLGVDRLPDLALRVAYETKQFGGSLRLLGRSLRINSLYNGNKLDKNLYGYGVGAGFNVNFDFGKIIVGGAFGNGIGRYSVDGANFCTVLDMTNNNEFKLIPIKGFHFAYDHYINAKTTLHLVYGQIMNGLSQTLKQAEFADKVFKLGRTYHASVSYKPIDQLALGIGFTHARLHRPHGINGFTNRVMLNATYTF